MHNILLNTDSYKLSHYLQYPPSTKYISSYIESRGGEFTDVVFFGLQMFIKEYLLIQITHSMIDEAKEVYSLHGVPFNETGWRYIVDKHNGRLPLKIDAIPEGTIVPVRNALVQVVNTDPKCAWLTSFVETALLRAVWYPTTVATQSYACKKIIKDYMSNTADDLTSLDFKLHDFGARGATSEESAGIGGLAHLLNFKGTDTVSALLNAKKYYGEDMAGFSIPAAEHSTITCWGETQEQDAYRNMIVRFGGENKTFAVVSDSYDLYRAIDEIWGQKLRDDVISNGGTVVIRPDSGDPVTVSVNSIEKLMVVFGYSVNDKGYRVLPDFVRVIQGDGISRFSMEAILEKLKSRKISAENISFGMGGELLQKINRDTLRFAMKASAAEIEGIWVDVYKNPITDQSKQSKRGRLAVIFDDNGFKTIRQSELNGRNNLLRTVYKDGDLIVDDSFSVIKERVNNAQF